MMVYFKELDKTDVTKWKIANGNYVDIQGIGVVAMEKPLSIKFILNVLHVLDISHNLLSVP